MTQIQRLHCAEGNCTCGTTIETTEHAEYAEILFISRRPVRTRRSSERMHGRKKLEER